MKYIIEFAEYLGKMTGIDSEYIKLSILTILIFLVFGIIKAIIKKIYSNLPVNDKKNHISFSSLGRKTIWTYYID